MKSSRPVIINAHMRKAGRKKVEDSLSRKEFISTKPEVSSSGSKRGGG